MRRPLPPWDNDNGIILFRGLHAVRRRKVFQRAERSLHSLHNVEKNVLMVFVLGHGWCSEVCSVLQFGGVSLWGRRAMGVLGLLAQLVRSVPSIHGWAHAVRGCREIGCMVMLQMFAFVILDG